MSARKDRRIFFALWPDDALRDGLARAASRIPLEGPARRVPAYNLHLTLHFIGNVFRDQLDCLQHRARGIEARGFDLVIDSIGYFARPRVAWLGCSALPAKLVELHEDLGARLRDCDYRPENRAYNPHVTVLRKLPRAPDCAAPDALRWRVRQFVLIESRAAENGVKYEVVETYPLA